MKMHATVTINKPIQQTWDYINDPDNLTKWLNNLEQYEHLSGDPKNPKPGDTAKHTYNERGRPFVMEEEIIAYEPPHHIQLLLTSGMFDMDVVNKLEEVDANTANLVATAEFIRTGLLMKLVLLFGSKSKLQATHEEQLKNLKALVEAQ